jgi:hypothetical protein
MKRYLSLCFLFLSVALHVRGQVTIAAGTNMGAVDGTSVVMETSGNLVNGSTTFDFANTNLTLSLISNAQVISGAWVVTQLNVVAGSNKDVSGNLTITKGITFNNGLLTPSGSGRIVYTGSASDITGDFSTSYVNGVFNVRSGGRMFFPVGADGLGYAPAWIENGNGTDEVGMEVIMGGANLAFDPSASELQTVDNTHYWQVSSANLAALGSQVTLSLNGIAGFGSEISPVVVQADNVGGQAENLLSALADGTAVTSRTAVTKPVLAVAGSREVVLRIYDIITPFVIDDFNDALHIENIEKFSVNTVTLLDRWGAPVKEWKNFTNYDDPTTPNLDGYDFTKLSPGNYICIVEYGNAETGMRKESQMITVLKAK